MIDRLLRWYVQRPYGQFMYRAYCTGNITKWEYVTHVYLRFWRWGVL